MTEIKRADHTVLKMILENEKKAADNKEESVKVSTTSMLVRCEKKAPMFVQSTAATFSTGPSASCLQLPAAVGDFGAFKKEIGALKVLQEKTGVFSNCCPDAQTVKSAIKTIGSYFTGNMWELIYSIQNQMNQSYQKTITAEMKANVNTNSMLFEVGKEEASVLLNIGQNQSQQTETDATKSMIQGIVDVSLGTITAAIAGCGAGAADDAKVTTQDRVNPVNEEGAEVNPVANNNPGGVNAENANVSTVPKSRLQNFCSMCKNLQKRGVLKAVGEAAGLGGTGGATAFSNMYYSKKKADLQNKEAQYNQTKQIMDTSQSSQNNWYGRTESQQQSLNKTLTDQVLTLLGQMTSTISQGLSSLWTAA